MKININNAKKKKVFITVFTGILLVCVTLVLFFIYKPQSNMNTSDNEGQSVNDQDTTRSSEPSTTQTREDENDASSGSGTAAPTISPTVVPAQPSGTFVSNHFPNISGSPAPNVISSTCTTTPGAQCKISFTKGNSEVSLDTQTTDSNGNTSWEWNLKTLGLGVGEWTVTATAINGDKTASSVDSMKLTVRE